MKSYLVALFVLMAGCGSTLPPITPVRSLSCTVQQERVTVTREVIVPIENNAACEARCENRFSSSVEECHLRLERCRNNCNQGRRARHDNCIQHCEMDIDSCFANRQVAYDECLIGCGG